MAINQCGLQAAESNRAVLRYLAEDTACWGVTPSTGKSREMRITASSLSASKETVVSNELRADRMVSDVVEVAASSGGDVDTEFSAGSLDDFMQAFLLGTWTRPMTFDKFTGTRVSINNSTATEIIIAGGDFTDYFVVGRRVKTEGFVNAVNNDYWAIASVSFTGGNTVIVATTDTGVTEAGNSYSKVLDANDVIVLNNTAIRAGTGGANAFDSNSGNAFASAIAAGQLVVGQKIYVSGLGYQVGTIVVASQPADGDTFSISDGDKTVTFEFDSDDIFARGAVAVEIGVDEAGTAANIQAAIMGQLNRNKLYVSASVATDTVTIRNLRDALGGVITEALASLTTTAFSAGDESVHGFFTVTGVTNDVITVAEEVGTLANTTIPVTIKGSHLRNPGDLDDIIAQSFTIETGFTDVDQYFVQTGLRVGGFSLSVASGELVSGQVSFMGKETTTRSTTLLGAAPYDVLASTATPVFNATSNIGAIYKNGELLATALQSIELVGEAALRNQPAVSSKFPAGIGTGRFNLTGSFAAYFETLEMFDHFLNHDTISLAFDFSDNDKNAYWFTMPAIKLTEDPIAPGGNDQDISEEISFIAIRDPNLGTMFIIDRFSSTTPATA